MGCFLCYSSPFVCKMSLKSHFDREAIQCTEVCFYCKKVLCTGTIATPAGVKWALYLYRTPHLLVFNFLFLLAEDVLLFLYY